MSQQTTKKKLLLIDGSNLAFRMFFALEMSNLRDPEGNPTWAVYGTLKALFDVIESEKPSAAAVAFDLPEPTYRHEVFEDYKANRPDEMPDDMQPQWEIIKDAFRRFHVPVLEEPGYEADDLIGIMAKQAEAEGYDVVILSGDKDLYQLVTDQIHQAVPKRGGGLEIFDPAGVIEKMGVTPVQVPDYKGIAGDSSDNIPGVKGLGPKAATKLLGEYGDLDGIYANIDKVGPPKTREKLVDQEDSARMSKHIATIITDPAGVKETDLSLEHCDLTMPDTDELIQFLKDLGFNSILKRLPLVLKPFNNGEIAKVDVGDLPMEEPKTYSSKSSKKATEAHVAKVADKFEKLDTPLEDLEIKPMIVVDEVSLNALVKDLEKVEIFAIDLETDGLNTQTCEIAGWAISYSKKKTVKEDKDIKSFYIPVRHENLKQLDADMVREKLKPILEDESKLQIIQNAKFEQKIFCRIGIKTHNHFFDTMIASYIENSANKHGLKAQCRRVFHKRMTEIEELIGTGRKQITINEVEIDKVAAYAAADAYITFKLYNYYQEALDDREKKLLNEIEFPLVAVLRDIEMAGVSLDKAFLEKLSVDVHKQIEDLEKDIHRLAGQEFKISSPKQLSDILFNQLSFPTVGRKNKSGGYSTDVGTLETLLNDYELEKFQVQLLESILEFRTLSKLTGTYIDTLPGQVSKETNRLHSDFNQVVTATGRLSSSNPNLQNIPVKSEIGRQIRKAFVPASKDKVLISADYSQVELRVLAHMANEKALVEAFKNDEDVHTRTAMEIFDLEADAVTSDHRRIGKTLNFALIYMQGPFATAKQLDISMKEAKEFINKYFKAFTKVQPFMTETLEFAHDNEFVETLFGRRRYFKNINSPNKMLSKEEERQAFNAAIQGTAADIMKIAMVSLDRKIEEKGMESKIILQVHDELVIESPQSEADEISEMLKAEMSGAMELKVPLKVDLGKGLDWLEAH